jgi:hypothetical protein
MELRWVRGEAVGVGTWYTHTCGCVRMHVQNSRSYPRIQNAYFNWTQTRNRIEDCAEQSGVNVNVNVNVNVIVEKAMLCFTLLYGGCYHPV